MLHKFSKKNNNYVYFCANYQYFVMIKDLLLVGAGGALGSMARYGITLVSTHLAIASEWGIFAANALGSLLIGILIAVSRGDWYLLCAVGFCGGFTTFSTFSAQALTLLQTGHRTMGLVYISASLIICISMTWFGLFLAEKLFK